MAIKKDPYFKYINVEYSVRYTARIIWEFTDQLQDQGNYSFQLQWNPNYDDPDAWINVGTPKLNVSYLEDDETRTYGKDRIGAYRIVVTTPARTIVSPPAEIYGKLTWKQWRLVRAILRRATKVPKRIPRRQGIMLKKKAFGYPCACRDPYTGGVTNSDCPTCHGTGVVNGYWLSAENILVTTGPGEIANEKATRIDPQLQRGTVSPEILVGIMTYFPPINYGDVWVDLASDRRYHVNAVKISASLAGVPLLAQVQMSLLPDTDPVYLIDVHGR